MSPRSKDVAAVSFPTAAPYSEIGTLAVADSPEATTVPSQSHAWKKVSEYCRAREGRRPDPRTTLLVVLVINIIALSRFNMAVSLLSVFVTLGALVISRAYRFATIYFTVQALWVFLIFVPSQVFPNPFTAFLMVFGFWMFKMFGIAGIAGYALHVLVPGELVAALRQLRVPVAITVPITVMLRFVPMVFSEYRAVREAMALRGLSMGWRALLHPLQYLEFILVPLLSSCARVADEMTAAGLVRGLGSKIRPTTINRLRFSLTDLAWVVVLVLLAAVTPWLQTISIAPGGFQ